jgi:hypothetical protein
MDAQNPRVGDFFNATLDLLFVAARAIFWLLFGPQTVLRNATAVDLTLP